jgi:hypothetical protein
MSASSCMVKSKSPRSTTSVTNQAGHEASCWSITECLRLLCLLASSSVRGIMNCLDIFVPVLQVFRFTASVSKREGVQAYDRLVRHNRLDIIFHPRPQRIYCAPGSREDACAYLGPFSGSTFTNAQCPVRIIVYPTTPKIPSILSLHSPRATGWRVNARLGPHQSQLLTPSLSPAFPCTSQKGRGTNPITKLGKFTSSSQSTALPICRPDLLLLRLEGGQEFKRPFP